MNATKRRPRNRGSTFRVLYEISHDSADGLIAVRHPAPWQWSFSFDLRGLACLALVILMWVVVIHEGLVA